MKKRTGFVVVLLSLMGAACSRTPEPVKKVAITTASEEARAAFLKGQTLVDNLRQNEAVPLFDEAISKDPGFAMAHLLRAQTSTTGKEFFAHLKSAVDASAKASEGERLLILGTEAGAMGDTAKRGEYWTKLAEAFPEDERVHQRVGVHYMGLQNYDAAIAELQKATQIAPGFAPAYNQLGYALRAADRDPEAEAAFRKYIELIPNEPNPHDSLAELLMKMGRFDESLESYRKALSLNPRFINAYNGIAADLMYQGKHAEALQELQKQYDGGSDNGQKQQSLVGMAICLVDAGKVSEALEKLSAASALAEQDGDKGAMSQHANNRGDLLLHTGKVAEAVAEYDKAIALAAESSLPDRIKKNIEVAHHADLARLACARKDFKTASSEAELMRAGFEPQGNPNQMRGVHELLGMIALEEKNYDDAIAQLNQANLQSPYVRFHLAKAYAAKKDTANSTLNYQKAAKAYTLPRMDYAMVRQQAEKALK